jgi:hypothetical protein
MARKSVNPHETILKNLDALTRSELEALQDMIAERLAAMKAKSGLLVDVLAQDEQPEPQEAKPEGWIEAKYIPSKSGKLCGPYYYQRWRDDAGKMHSKYLKGYGRKMKQADNQAQEATQE